MGIRLLSARIPVQGGVRWRHRRCRNISAGTARAGPTFADIAARYLERHVRRHLVPRAYELAQYAHTFLTTVDVAAPNGGRNRSADETR